MLRSSFSWAAACLLLAVCVSPAAVASPAPAAWVEFLAADPEGEALRPVVEQAVRYRLEPLGLAVLTGDARAGTRAAGRTPPGSEALLAAAKRAGADFALESRCSGSGSRLSLQLSWFEVPARLMTAAVDRKGSVDLEMDSVILGALDELLARVRDRIAERVAAAGGPAVVDRGSAGGAGTGLETEGTAGTAGTPGAGGEGTATPEHPATELPAGGTLPDAGTIPGAPSLVASGRYAGARLLVAPSVAPFLAVGAASYYFPVGYQSILQIGALPAGAKGRLGLGGLVGVTAFQAQGATESSLSFLAPLGVSVRYGLELGQRWGLLFHVGAGPAFLLMDTGSLGTLVKVLPFVRSGVGCELALGRTASLGLEAAYEVYFETPYLIMGFTPGLILSWRL